MQKQPPESDTLTPLSEALARAYRVLVFTRRERTPEGALEQSLGELYEALLQAMQPYARPTRADRS